MPKLLTIFLALARRDTNVIRAARFLSFFLILLGVGWLFLLPLDLYNRHTYISENALLPGQVHTYFGGSEHTVFRAYRHEVNNIAAHTPSQAAHEIEDIFKSQGLKTARQSYNFTYPGFPVAGENAYALLEGPRADATEAMVLMASIHNINNEINYSGVALVLTMARYFKRWSLWSKDVLFVITTDSTVGPHAWVSAYHDLHEPATTDPLALKAGAIQAAVAIDYPASPAGHRFDKLHVMYDGINGALPNLDLLNTFVAIAKNQVGISSSIQGMHSHTDSYTDRLQTIFRGILSSAAGRATGPHSAFMPFHIDAITLQTVGNGWHDEMSLGMVVESGFRSINNLLEKLHQSFFFYLLMGPERFASIGNYLQSALLVAGSFSITAVALWLQSGKPGNSEDPKPSDPVQRNLNRERARSRAQSIAKGEKPPPQEMATLNYMGNVTVVPVEILQSEERSVGLPILLVLFAHVMGLMPFWFFLAEPSESIMRSWTLMLIYTALAPIEIYILFRFLHGTPQQLTLMSSFSLLILGISLATLSTLNFSLGLLVGLCAAVLNFITPPLPNTIRSGSGTNGEFQTAMLTMNLVLAASPNVLTSGLDIILVQYGGADLWKSLWDLERSAAFAWNVYGTWSAVVVWMVWWPAWVIGATVAVDKLARAL